MATCFSVSYTPVQVKGENVLWQQLSSHNAVKNRSEVRYGRIGHAQDAVEARGKKRSPRLLHRFSKLLARQLQTCDLQAGEAEEERGKHKSTQKEGVPLNNRSLSVGMSGTHRDRVLADEAGQLAALILDEKQCAVRNICA